MADSSKPGMLERLAPKLTIAHASADLEPTNALLRELVTATTRFAVALEALVLHTCGVDLTVIPEVTPAQKITDPKLRDDDTSELEETLAAIELMEDRGIPVPSDVYKHLGIEPPRTLADRDPEFEDESLPPEPPAATKDLG